jgi:hypothetical protein
MKKFYVTVLRSFPRGIRTVNRIVPAKNEREAIANCSYADEVVSCERLRRTRPD